MTPTHDFEQLLVRQREYNARSIALGSILRTTGWSYASTLDAFCKGPVRIYMNTGNLHIQRRLMLAEEAYLRLSIKTNSTPARDVLDSLDVDIDETFRTLMDAVDETLGRMQPEELCAA